MVGSATSRRRWRRRSRKPRRSSWRSSRRSARSRRPNMDERPSGGLPGWAVLSAGVGQFLGGLLKPVWAVVGPAIGVALVMKIFGLHMGSSDLVLLLVAVALLRDKA